MKLLHIGKEANIQKRTVKNAFTDSIERKSLPMGLAVEEYLKAMPDAEVLVVDAIADIPAKLIEKLPNLKLIHSEGVAYNRIDTASATKHGVSVCNCAGCNDSAVAEQAVLLMLGMLKDVVANDLAVRSGSQIQVKEGYMVRGDLKELADCQVGLIGFGDIGKATARLLKCFGARVVYEKRTPLSEEEETFYGVTRMTREELLSSSDIVSLHLPVNPQTEKMCDAAFFAGMKEGAYLVNTSRGELVDDEALVEALRTGRLSMVGLDTLDYEPVQKDHILVTQPPEIAGRILFSPHIGGITNSSFRRAYGMIWENIERLSKGEALKNVVNKR